MTREETAAKLEVLCGKDCAERYLQNGANLKEFLPDGFVSTPEGSMYWNLTKDVLDAGEVSSAHVASASAAAARAATWAAWAAEAWAAWKSLHEHLSGEVLKAKDETPAWAKALTPPTANVGVGLSTDRTLLEIAKDWLRREDECTLDDRARVKAEAMRAALEGARLVSMETTTETHPEATNLFKPTDDIPGEELVGRVCYVWNNDLTVLSVDVIARLCKDGMGATTCRARRGFEWEHARPIELGLPDWFKA